MNTLIVLLMSIAMFGIGLRYRLFVVSLTNVSFLIAVNAALHFILMAELYRESVGVPSDSLYLQMTALCYCGLLAGFSVAQWLIKAFGIGKKSKTGPSTEYVAYVYCFFGFGRLRRFTCG